MNATKESIASLLHGSTYPVRIPAEVKEAAKAAGVVIVYGASDDLMEFDGAIYDEIGAYDETLALVDRQGVLDRSQIDDGDDNAIADYVTRKKTASSIWARYGNQAPYWTYSTNIPHATFDVVEDGEVYCVGIVFAIADLPA